MAARQRGTVIILVVVAIGLLAFMGATYLQVSRVQRQQEIDPVENIDLALQSVIQEIAITLREDIFDPTTGNYFDSAAGIEPYDRPWTNPAGGTTYQVFERDGTTVAGNAQGGRFDDTWLASALPVQNGAGDWIWPQITTLTGGWYDSNGNALVPARFVDPSVQGDTPPDRIVASADGTDFNFDVFGNANLVDADADGMPDARWERAPLALKDGEEFFMAVRIVDLASFLNANIATSLVDGTGSFDTSPAGTNAPRGIYPSELNLAGYVAGNGGTLAEMAALLTAGRGVADATWATREAFWEDAGSRLGDVQSPFLILPFSEQLELSYRAGSQDFPQTNSVLEQEMPTFMADIPGTSTDVYGIETPGDANAHYPYGLVPRTRLTTLSSEALFAPLLPGDPSVTPDNIPAEQQTTRRLKLPLNHPDLDVEITLDPTDPSHATTVNDPLEDQRRDAAEPLARDIEAIFRLNSATLTLPGGAPNSAVLGAQLVANLQDYRDSDNIMTVHDVLIDIDNTLPYTDLELEDADYSGNEVYGFEAYPFITEVYVQRRYEITGTPAPDAAGDFPVTWDATDGGGATSGAGFAIEIRNPFNYPITLDHIRLELLVPPVPPATTTTIANIATINPTTLGQGDVNTNGFTDLADLVSDARNAVVRTMEPNEVLVLYRNPDDGVNIVDDTLINDGQAVTPGNQWAGSDSMIHDAQDQFSYGGGGSTITYVQLNGPDEWPKDPPNSPSPMPEDGMTTAHEVFLRLIVPVGNADAANDFVYQITPTRAAPDSYTETIPAPTGPDPAPAGGEESYYQHTDLGNAHRLNAMAVDNTEYLAVEQVPNYLDPNPAGRGFVSRLGQDVKTDDTTVDPNGDKLGGGGTSTATTGGAASYPEQTLGWTGTAPLNEQWLLANDPDSFIHSSGELLNLVLFGPVAGQTIPERLSAQITAAGSPLPNLNAFRLDPDSGTPIAATPVQWAWQVNHATFLMSRVTTYSPGVDGFDNDGDGTDDNEREQTVAGRLNYNGLEPVLPAPGAANMLSDVLPLADPAWRDTTADEMRALMLNGAANPSRTPGLAHLWSGFTWPTAALRRAAATPGDTQAAGARLDHLLNSIGGGDAIADDREEALLLLSQLDQIGTNRSDVFVAYILVHGYDSTDYSLGPIETARAIVLFDRSKMLTHDDVVQPTLLYRFP